MSRFPLQRCILWLVPYITGHQAYRWAASAETVSVQLLAAFGVPLVGILIFNARLDLWRPER